MSTYKNKPSPLLKILYKDGEMLSPGQIACVGFDLGSWRCDAFARHLIDWLPDYALAEDSLAVHHGNAYVKLQEAAVRIYTSEHYRSRGEIGEITLHAICREYFSSIPLAHRVFYKSSSNDPIKGFDLVHVRFPAPNKFELLLGEAKFYSDGVRAVREAISSVGQHIGQGFLDCEKLLLGPQISKSVPMRNEIVDLFLPQTGIGVMLSSSVFVIGIACDSAAIGCATSTTNEYVRAVSDELSALAEKVRKSNLVSRIKLEFVYVPIRSKDELSQAFDRRLKGLQ